MLRSTLVGAEMKKATQLEKLKMTAHFTFHIQLIWHICSITIGTANERSLIRIKYKTLIIFCKMLRHFFVANLVFTQESRNTMH